MISTTLKEFEERANGQSIKLVKSRFQIDRSCRSVLTKGQPAPFATCYMVGQEDKRKTEQCSQI